VWGTSKRYSGCFEEFSASNGYLLLHEPEVWRCISDDFWPCDRPEHWPRAWPLQVAAKGAQWLKSVDGDTSLKIQLVDPHEYEA
jgi:hypothetical protein